MDNLTAILLCGGKGERLKPFTDLFPKPLVPLAGRPILQYLIEHLESAGLRRFVVCTGYKAELIDEFLDRVFRPRRDIVSVNSGEAATMTDRLRGARTHVPGRALVCYGDTLANVDIEALQQQHQRSGVAATMTVHPLRSPFGLVEFDEANRVTAFAEKPLLPYWINIGFLLCEPAALDQLTPGTDMPEFLSRLAAQRQLGSYRHAGRHLTVNDEKERQSAEAEVIQIFSI